MKSSRATVFGSILSKWREDDLQRSLVELNLALDVQQIALLEGPELVFRGVPQTGTDGPGAVAQLQLQEKNSIAIGPELFVADQESLLEVFAVRQLLHETPRHGWASLDGMANVQPPWRYQPSLVLISPFFCMVHAPSWQGTKRKRLRATHL